MEMIQEHNIEEKRLMRALTEVNIYAVDENGDELPDHCFYAVTENGRHYCSTSEMTCDCRDFIMKGVREEGYDTGVVCKHLLAALFYYEEHPVVEEAIDNLKSKATNGIKGKFL